MRRLMLGCALVVVAGCGEGPIVEPPTETGTAQLQRFQSENELVNYFRQEASRTERFSLNEVLDDADTSGGETGDLAHTPPGAEGPAMNGGLQGAADGIGHSGTTIQEEGVDEADVVKTDGAFLYLIDGGLLRIVDVRDGGIREVSRVELEGSGQDIYLVDDMIVSLTQNWGWFYHDVRVMMERDVTSGPAEAEGDPADDSELTGPSVVVTVLNVADRAAPQIVSTTRFEGNLISSRLIGKRMHLALAIYPEDLGGVFPVGGSRMQSMTLKASDILPNFECLVEASGEKISGDLLTYNNVYRPADPDGYGMVSVISLDVDAPARFHAIGVMANPGLTYASLDAFYLTDTAWTFWGDERQTTDIYKFAYTETGVELAGVGMVNGRVLNSYSLGEYNGHLRVATTTSSFDAEGFTSGNHVYVLAQNGDALNVVGKIENLAPGETIQSARFIGDRGYLVTFEQVDPLFTLDLSNPVAPAVVGELKVPGFSTFIVPMDANHLLTVGQYVPEDGSWIWGVQLSIFDVTDFAAPALKHQVVLADGAWSEALYNPKALTYFAEGGVLALPVTVPNLVVFDEDFVIDGNAGTSDGGGDIAPPIWDFPMYRDEFQGVIVYRVSSDAGFTEALRLDTRQSDDPWTWGPSFTRGVFVGANVYAVTNSGVVSGSLQTPDVAGPTLKFEQPESSDPWGGGIFMDMPW